MGTVQEETVAALAADFGGDLIKPDEATYDEARQVWNAMIQRRPALVARPTGTADVIAAVTYAREQGLPVAVRGGAHSAAGHGSCDDGVVLDLSRMKGVHVDVARRTARAAGGVQWGEYDRETQAFGLHTPGGRITTTGVGGFTVGGGYGWTSPKFGLTCDNLISADVVTGNGELVTASETENEDLFWGLRGGGSNFGVVTSFEFRLHELGPIVLGGMLIFPLEQGEQAMAAYREVVEDAPDELSTAAAMVTAPPEEFVPEHLRGKPVLGFLVSYAGDPEEGAKVVAPLRAAGPVVDLVGPVPYRALQAMLDPMAPPGLRSYWRGLHLNGMSDDVVETFLRFPTEGLGPLSFLIIFQHGGAVSRVPDDAMAFSHRAATFMAHPVAAWDSPADDERHIAWVKDVTDAFEPVLTGGVYLNFMTELDRVQRGYSPEKWDRLVALKERYDPDNLFRFNQNIAYEPAGAAA